MKIMQLYLLLVMLFLSGFFLFFWWKLKKRSNQMMGVYNDSQSSGNTTCPSGTPPQIVLFVNTAKSQFCGPENYNCAQAILAAYQDCCAIQESEILAAGSKGFGKARDGICGALYAGELLLKDPAKAEQLGRDFEMLAGSVKCKKILKLRRITCEECVGHTARLLAEHLLPGRAG